MHALCLAIAPPLSPSLPEIHVPTLAEARDVCCIVQAESKQPKRRGQPYLTYEGFTSARKRVQSIYGSKFDFCFRPRLFLRASAGKKGKVGEDTLCSYVLGYAAQEQHAFQLKKLSQDRSGSISLKQAEEYIASLDLFERQGMQPEMAKIGNKMGALKVAFYHSNRSGRIKLSDFITGHTMEEIIKVQQALEEKKLEAIPTDSWFSLQKVRVVHDTFCELDKSRRGVIVPEQLLAHRDTKFTSLFVNRLFEEHGCIQDGRNVLEWNNFVKFVLAWSDRNNPNSIRYLLPIFDVHKRGYLTSMDIYTFVQSSVKAWMTFEPGAYTPSIMEDIVNEMFDLIHPIFPGKISTKDFGAAKNSGTMLGIMGDAYELWQHEHREDQ